MRIVLHLQIINSKHSLFKLFYTYLDNQIKIRKYNC
jgi:hypothetical protein